MNSPREDLLRPSLSGGDSPVSAPYSMQTTFLTGFFGGPFAAIAIFAINSFRLRRISRDLPVGIGMLLVVLLGMWVLHRTAPGGAALAWLEASLGSRSIRFVHQMAGLLIVGAAYLLHRREQRNSDLLGLKRPNGWVAGIACILLGTALSIVCLAALRM
ncbi:MAG: hypothetical protein KIS79_12635 [Burkholderiales bacterium]|nr:hypothetical protein [Burkholderiales bacterium]